MLNLILALLLGILAGTLTGLIPGIHINLITALLLTLSFPSTLSPTTLIIFIIALSITHTFLDFIPSIFLGAPSEDTFFSTLPGHKLLLEGNGHKALLLTLIGSTISIISLIIIIPTFIFIIPTLYPFLQKMMGFFLIWIIIFLISTDKENKIKAIIIFTLAGFLGLASLNSSVNQPLLPLLTGLFATSTLIHSINQKTIIPQQKIKKISIKKSDLIKPTLATILISPICSLFPGLGSSQAAITISQLIKKTSQKQFLILLGSINTLVMATSFLTLILFQKSRTGSSFAISQITTLTTSNLPIIITSIITSSIITIPIAIIISKSMAKNIHKIPYQKISITIIIFLIITNFLVSGLLGLLILITSTSLGLTCIKFKTRRSFLMGAILIPTILFYLPF